MKRPKRSLQLDELDVLSPTIRDTGIPCFAVAYSLADVAVDAKWLELVAREAPQIHANIMKEFNPTHRYAYMVANYFTTLKNSPAGNDMIQDIDFHEKQPEFDTIFKPNTRALAVGRIIPKNTNKTLGVGPTQVNALQRKIRRERTHQHQLLPRMLGRHGSNLQGRRNISTDQNHRNIISRRLRAAARQSVERLHARWEKLDRGTRQWNKACSLSSQLVIHEHRRRVPL